RPIGEPDAGDPAGGPLDTGDLGTEPDDGAVPGGRVDQVAGGQGRIRHVARVGRVQCAGQPLGGLRPERVVVHRPGRTEPARIDERQPAGQLTGVPGLVRDTGGGQDVPDLTEVGAAVVEDGGAALDEG